MSEEATIYEKETRRRRLAIGGIIAVLVAAMVGGYAVYRKVYPAHLANRAQAALALGHERDAARLARRALGMDSANAHASSVMADVCEAMGVSDAVHWRRRSAELSGGSAEAWIAYAFTAVRFGKEGDAQSALAAVPEHDRSRADFNAASGALALNKGQFAEAERFYTEACRLEPQVPEHRLSLGKAQAASDDYLIREAGRRLLSEMGEHPSAGLSALRALIASYHARGELTQAIRESGRLLAAPGCTLADGLRRLRLLRLVGDEAFRLELQSWQEKGARNEKDAALVVAWMSVEGLAAEAVDWATVQVPALAQMPSVQPSLAACYLALEDWPALLAITQFGPWKSVEHIRHAFRACAIRQQGNPQVARSAWTAALDEAETPAKVAWLLRTSKDWHWPEAKEESLWRTFDLAPTTRSTLDTLYRGYETESNTAGLRRVAAHLVKLEPANEKAQNNLAMFSLLLDMDKENAIEMALQLHRKHPEDVVYASTAAFALHCAKQPEEALRVLESFPATEIEAPNIAAYYGIILAANNLPEKALQYLALGEKAALLPEERELVKRAQLSIRRGAPATILRADQKNSLRFFEPGAAPSPPLVQRK